MGQHSSSCFCSRAATSTRLIPSCFKHDCVARVHLLLPGANEIPNSLEAWLEQVGIKEGVSGTLKEQLQVRDTERVYLSISPRTCPYQRVCVSLSTCVCVCPYHLVNDSQAGQQNPQ
jgi:hypothetical protein